MKKRYNLTNLDCAHCAAKMEDAIKKIEGVRDASVNFMTQKLMVETEEEKLEEIMEEVVRICKKIEPDCVIHM